MRILLSGWSIPGLVTLVYNYPHFEDFCYIFFFLSSFVCCRVPMKKEKVSYSVIQVCNFKSTRAARVRFEFKLWSEIFLSDKKEFIEYTFILNKYSLNGICWIRVAVGCWENLTSKKKMEMKNFWVLFSW